MGYIASNYKKSNYKVILSEQAYARLSGLINLCGLNINGEYDEFGSLIYGRIDPSGVLYLDNPSEVEDNKIQSKAFVMSESMWTELDNKLKKDGCRLVAHFHTHPYFQDDRNRLYSDSDISFYQKFAVGVNRDQEPDDKIMVLGCMASVNYDNTPSLDDLSIVYYDIDQKTMLYIPEVYVKIKDKEHELKNVKDEYSFGNQTYPMNRTLLEVNTENAQVRH